MDWFCYLCVNNCKIIVIYRCLWDSLYRSVGIGAVVNGGVLWTLMSANLCDGQSSKAKKKRAIKLFRLAHSLRFLPATHGREGGLRRFKTHSARADWPRRLCGR